MSTEGSIGVKINIEDNFSSVERNVESVVAAITTLDNKIGTTTRTINVHALLQDKDFKADLAKLTEQGHSIKVHADVSAILPSITEAVSGTVHTVRTTVNIEDLKTMIGGVTNEPHKLNLTVDTKDLDTKVENAIKNKLYPVKIDFTVDSAVTTALTGIQSAMESIKQVTQELQQITTNSLSGLENQMKTYFNDLNHIMDLTNKVAATVEKTENKKIEAIEKTAKVRVVSEDTAFAKMKALQAEEAKAIEKKQSDIDAAYNQITGSYTKHINAINALRDSDDAKAAKSRDAAVKKVEEASAKEIAIYESGSEKRLAVEAKIQEETYKLQKQYNEAKINSFREYIEEQGKLITDQHAANVVRYEEEQTLINKQIDAFNKMFEAKSRVFGNLSSSTFEGTGKTGANPQQGYADRSMSTALGGTGKSQNDLKKEAEVEAIAHKERVDAWKNFLEQVGVITHEANVAHEKEFMRNHSYEEYITKAHTQALAEEANRNNKLHEEALKINEKITTDYQNKQIKAFEESVFMNKKHTEALSEDAARYNKLHEEALKINEKIDKDYHNSVIKAHEDDIYMSKKHTDALIEDQHRYNMMHEEALRMNLKITTDYQNMQIKAFEDEQYMMRKHMQALAEDAARGHDATNTRGAKLNSGQALAISPADIAALREYRAEIERTHGPVSRLQNSFYSLNNTLMQLGIYMSGRQLLEYADQWIHFTSMVRIASNDYINAINERLEGEAKISESQKKLFAQRQIDEVFKISQDTRMGIHDTAMLFMRMSRAAEAMGIDFDKAKLLTEQLGKSMMVMGLSPAMARGALLQLEQALGGVVVRGQEFKSVNDGLPIIMRTIAKHYNEQKAAIDAVSLGMAKGSKEFDEYIQKNKGHALSLKELRDLMLKGEMYSSISAAALLSKEAIAEIDEQTAHMHTTFAQAFTLIENGFIKYIGKLNESSGASEVFYGWAKKLSESFDVFGSVIAGLVVPIGTAMLAMGALEMATKAVNLAMAANIYLKIIGAVVLLTTSLSGLAATHGDLVSGMTGNWEQFMKMWENPEDNSFIKTLKEAIKLLSELFTLSEQNPLSAIGKGLARVAEDLGIAMSVLGQNVFGTSNDPNDYSKDSTVGKINLARIKAQEDNLNKELRDSEYLDKIIDLDKLTRDEKLRLIAVGKERFAAEQALVQIAKMQAERTREAAMTPEQKSVEDEIDRAMKLRDQVLNKGKSEGEKINSRELAETKIPTGGDERKLAMGRLGFYENGIESAMTQTVKGAQWEEAVRAYKQVKEEAEKTAAAKKLEKDLEKDAASAKTKEEKALRDRQAIEKDILSMHDSREAMEVRQLNLMERQVNYAKMSTEELRNQLSLSAEKLQKIELKPFEITINTDVAEGKLMQLGEKFNGTIPASVQKLQPLIDAAVAKYPTVSADVIRAIIMHESMGENIGTKILNKYGKPASTAFGVGQITNPTAKTLGIDNHNVEQSVMGIAKLLTILGKAFDNNLPKMLAGYAAGEAGARAGGGKVSAAEVLALIPKANNEDIQKMIDRNLANSVGAQQVSTQAVAGLNVPQGQAVQTGNHATDLANAKAYNDAYVKAVREADEYQMKHGKEFTKEYADSFTTMYKSLVKGQNTASANLQQRLAEDTKAYDELLKRILEARDLEDRPMVAGEKSRVKNEVGDLVRAKGWDAVPELQGRAQAKSGELMQTESALAHFKGTNMSGMNAEQKSTYEGIIGTLTTKQKMLKNEIALTSDEAERLNGEKLDKYTNELNKAESAIKNMKLDKVDYSPFLTSMKELTTSMQGMFGETFDRISTGFSSAMSVGLESMSKLDEMNVASKEKEIANQKEIAAISDPKLKEEALARHNKEKTAMDSAYVQTVVGGTAKMAGAASKMFAENSAGRKALHAIEVGLHGVELAMSFAKTAASMAAGAAKFFEQSGWAGFAGVAAMVAVMAGFGIMAGGGGGGAKDSSTPDTKTSGSVLGDSEASSNSVKNIIETLNNIHYSEYAALLDIAANFKNMSKAIDGSIIMAVQQHGTFSGSTKGMSGGSVSPLGSPAKAIGGVLASTATGAAGVGTAVLGAGANALIGAGATTIGGAVGGVATSMASASISTGLAMGASSSMASLVGGMALGLAGGLVIAALQYGLGKLLGIGKVKYEAIGYGIVTKATEMIIDGSDKAMVVYDYTKVKQTIKGWFSDTVKIYDVVNGINQELTGSISTVFSTFKNVLKDTAKTLDITQYMDTAFTVPKIKLSFTKLKSEDIAKKITDALNTTMDNITTIVTNGLVTPFQKMGEGALEAFVRIGAETVIINETFKRAGYNLGSSGMGLVQISQSLLDLYESSDKANDGLKNFLSAFDSLMKTITTAGEKLQMNLSEMQNRLNTINAKGAVLSEGTKPVTFNQDFSKTLATATVDYTTPLKTAMEATSVDFRKNLTSKFNTVIDETTGKSRKMTTDEKKTRAEDIFGKDYAATMGARDYTLNRNEISTLTLGQLKGSIEGTVTSAFKYLTDTATKTLNAGKTSAVTAAYEESKSADVTRLSQNTAIESLLKIVNTPTAENLAPYVTGGIDKTKTMSNEQLISAASIVATSLTNKTYSPDKTLSLAQAVPQLKTYDLGTDPLQLTGDKIQKALGVSAENLASLNEVSKVMKDVLQKLPNMNIDSFGTTNKAQYKSWVTDGKLIEKSDYTLKKTGNAAVDFASLTSANMTDTFKKNLFGPTMDSSQQGKWQTNGEDYNPFYKQMAQMVQQNDQNVAKLAEMKSDPAKWISDNFKTISEDNKKIMIQAITTITSMDNQAEQIQAVRDLDKTYTSLISATGSYTQALTDAEPYVKASLQGITNIKTIAESALSKITTASETKTRVNANSLLDLNDTNDISAVLNDLGAAGTKLLVNARKWIATQSAEQIATLGMTESMEKLISAEDEANGQIFMTERALKAFDNAMTTLKTNLDAAKSAMTNFQKSISEWVQSQKLTNVGNTKTQLDAASRKYDQLLLQITTPGTSAEDKNLALGKITGAADSMITAIRNYYGTSKAGADMTAKIIDQMDKLPQSVSIQELMLGELQKIKDNTATLPKFEGMSELSKTTIDELAKSIKDAVAKDATDPSLANTAILDAKANIMLVLQKATAGAKPEDAVFLDNLVSAVGGGKGLSATIDTVVNSKLGTTTINDVLTTLKTSFAGLEVEIQKVRMNPTEENIKQMQADIDKFKALTVKINGNVEALKLDPENPTLKKDLQDSLNEMNDFTAKVTGVVITSGAKREVIGDLKESFSNSTFKINPSLSYMGVLELKNQIRDVIASIDTKLSLKENTVATAELRASLAKTFSTIDSKVFTELDGNSQFATLSTLKTLFAHIEAVIDSEVNESKKQQAYTSLNRSFSLIPAIVNAQIGESARIEALDTLKTSFKTITQGIFPIVNEDLKNKAVSILDKAFDSVEATINSTVGEQAKKATFAALTQGFSAITAVVNSDMNDKSKDMVLGQLGKAFDNVTANVNSKVNESTKLTAANTLKQAFDTITNDIMPIVDEVRKNQAVGVITKAFSSVNATINSTVGDSAKKATFSALTSAFSAVTAVINSDMNQKSKDTTLGKFEKAFDNITANINSKVNDSAKIAASNIMKQAFDTITNDILPIVDEGKKSKAVAVLDKAFDSIDATINSTVGEQTKKATFNALTSAFSTVKALINSDMNEKSKDTVVAQMAKAFDSVTASINSKVNEASKTAAMSIMKQAFDTITDDIIPLVDEAKKAKAVSIMDAAFDTIDAAVKSSMDEKAQKATYATMQRAFSAVPALINSDMDEKSQGIALKALENGFKAVKANVISDLDDSAKATTANELKEAFSKMTQLISVQIAPGTMEKAVSAMDKAFTGIDALITSNVDPRTKQAASRELTNAFGTIKTLVESSIDTKSQETAIDKLEAAFRTVEAVAKATISPESKTAAVNSLKGALAGVQVLVNDVALNPTDNNIKQLNDKIKRFGTLTTNVEATIQDINIGKKAETDLAKDIAALDEFTAEVDLGLKSTATSNLNTQIADLTTAIKSIKVNMSVNIEGLANESISRIEGLKDMSADKIVFNIQIPQISTQTIDVLTQAIKNSITEVIKMQQGFDGMLSKASDVQKAIDLFTTGNAKIQAFVPAANEIRNKQNYVKLENLGIEDELRSMNKAKDITGWETEGSTKLTEKTALAAGNNLYKIFNNKLSEYNKKLSYVQGYNETHPSKPVDMTIFPYQDESRGIDMTNEDQYAAGQVVGVRKDSATNEFNKAKQYYNDALNIIKANSKSYFQLSGYNIGGGGIMQFADGGAFTNGIVSTPTAFNMGLMGEAGPEAIMPLVQTSSGGLGVRAMSAANDSNNNSEEELREVKKQNQILMAQNAILQEGFKQLISVNNKQADSLDNMESNSRRKSA